LGTGEEKIQEILKSTQKKYPSHLGLKIAFDESVAHSVYAGSDFFLIPSRYEPCGLTQMYSLKYGTIPVVRATGGLDDTIQEYHLATNTGNGFKFEDYSAKALVEALKRALRVYERNDQWKRLISNAMTSDFSWERAVREYLKIYERIAGV
jgi:starch synthase